MSRLQILSAAGAAFALAAFCGAAQSAPPTLFIQADMVTGGQQGMGPPPCVLASQFKHKEEIVWRIRVIDAKTGKPLDDKGVKSVVITLASGQSVTAHFGNHPPPKPVDTFWSAAWVVPDDYPTGSFSYDITATDKHGHAVKFQPFKTPPALPTIIADSGAK
jgi:hypothetical protein